jgi:hypothetical protein
MPKLSETTPITVLKNAPWTISKLTGENPALEDVVQHPTYTTIFNTVKTFVRAGAMRYINGNVYLVHENPLKLGVHSLRIIKDCTKDELIAKHMSQEELSHA